MHQGPGRVEFTRDESTPIVEEDEDPPGAETITVPDDEQRTVRVVATFSEPGEYMLRARVDNWRAPDSSNPDNCCWTNGYVRVTVR